MSMTSITRILRMLGKFSDDMVFACVFCAVAMQLGCGGGEGVAAGAEELLQGRKS